MRRTAAAALCLLAALALLAAAARADASGLVARLRMGAAGASAGTGAGALQPAQKPAAPADGFSQETVNPETGDPIKPRVDPQEAARQALAGVPIEDIKQAAASAKVVQRWNYSLGGADWTEGVCAVGLQQSPIAIDAAEVNATVQIGAPGMSHFLMHFNYSQPGPAIMNFNGHTLSVRGDLGGLETGCCRRDRYKVLSFHFHSPSGHWVPGPDGRPRQYPLEMRIVHQREGAKPREGILVVSVMFELDNTTHPGPNGTVLAPRDNPFLEEMDWDDAPSNVNVDHHIARPVRLDQLRKTLQGNFYVYNGSLAAPTCDEGVEWRIMETHAHVSPRQLQRVEHMLVRAENPARPDERHGNIRNLQPRNGRPIYHFVRHVDPCHTDFGVAEGHCCVHHCCGDTTPACGGGGAGASPAAGGWTTPVPLSVSPVITNPLPKRA